MFVSCVQPVAMRSAVFCTVCILCIFVVDAMGDHMMVAYSSMGLVMAKFVCGEYRFFMFAPLGR